MILIKSLKNILLFLFSIGLSVVFIEFLLRVTLPYDVSRSKEAESYFESMLVDKDGHRQLKPSKATRLTGMKGIDFKVSTNSNGFRGAELVKNSSNKKIIFVGDSFTFGYGVDNDQTYPYHISKPLEKLGYDVINAGVSGWGGAEQLKFISSKAKKYSPSVIVHGFYLNDISDAYNNSIGKKDYVESYYKKKKIVENYIEDYGSIIMKAKYFLKKNTYFYPFAHDWYQKAIDVIDSNKYLTLGSTNNPDFTINNVGDKGITLIDLVKEINEDNIIYEYEVFSILDSNVSLKIWRKNKEGYIQVAQSKLKPIEHGKTRIKLNNPIKVKKGDIVGFYTSNSSLTNEIPLGKSYDVYDFGNVNFISNLTAKTYSGRSGGYSLKIFMNKVNTEPNKNFDFDLKKIIISEANKKQQLTHEAYIKNINNFKCDKQNKDLISFYCKNYTDQQKYKFDIAIDHIVNMYEKSKELNSKFVVIYLTPIYEFYGKQINNKDIDLKQPYWYLSKKLKQKGINIYDMKLRSKDNKIFFIPDSHYNKNGYKAISNKLLDILLQKNLL